MKLFIVILLTVIVAASFFADYKWRRWMDARKREREEQNRR